MRAEWCRELAHFCGVAAPIEAALREAVAAHQDDPRIHRRLQDSLNTLNESTERNPLVDWPAGESDASYALVYCLLLLDLADRIRNHHHELGIDPDITKQTVAAKSGTAIRQFWELNGFVGASSNGFTRLDWYLGPIPMVCLGTFAYEPRAWGGGARVFRRKRDGCLKLLAEDGDYFDDVGRRLESNMDHTGCFAAALDCGEVTCGYPISSRGTLIQQQEDLNPVEWQQVLQIGDPVVQMHIPFDTNLSLPACRESFLSAIRFYEKHFPDYGATFFACGSWIHTPDLREILSPQSNLLKLQDAVHLMQNAAECRAGYKYIFGFGKFDPKTAPRQTSLQRGLLDYLDQGNTFHKGAMILPFSEAEHLGQLA